MGPDAGGAGRTGRPAIVVLAPQGRVGQWLREELAVLVRAGLVRNCWWAEGGDADAPLVTPAVTAAGAIEEADPQNLFEALANDTPSRLHLVRVAMAGTPSHAIDARALDARVREVWGHDRYSRLNVLVPTEVVGQESTVARSDLLRGWCNAVVAPEDRRTPSGSPRPIEADGRYVAHAAAAVAAVAGLMVTMPSGPFDEVGDTDIAGDVAHGCVVVRTRSRSLLFGRVADTVAARALHAPPPARPTYAGSRPARPTEDAGAIIQWAVEGTMEVDAHALRLRYEAPSGPDLQRYIGLIGVLRLVWDFLRRKLPGVVAARARSAVDDRVAEVEERISARILGSESAFVLRLFPGDAAGQAVRPEEEVGRAVAAYAGDHRDFPYSPPTRTWEHLVALCTGLFDAGPVPDEKVNAALREGGEVTVVADPSRVVGPLGGEAPAWAVPDALAAAVGWDPRRWRRCDARYLLRIQRRLGALVAAPDEWPTGIDEVALATAAAGLDEAIADQRPALLWQLAEQMAAEIDDAVTLFRTIEDVLRPQPDPPKPRRRWTRFVGLSLALVAVAVVVTLLPVAAIVVTATLVIAGLLWAVTGAGVALGWVRDRWADSIRRRQGEELRQWALANRYWVLAEIHRLDGNYTQLLDWSTIIGAVFDAPFGPPAVHGSELDPSLARELLAHQIARGDASTAAFHGAVSRTSRRLYAAGWLGEVLHDITDRAMAAFQVRTGLDVEVIDPPTRDRTLVVDRPALDAQSSRGHLREQISRPETRFDIRLDRWQAARRGLAEGEISDLIDEVEGGRATPLAFLCEAIELARPETMIRSLWTREVPPDEVVTATTSYGPAEAFASRAEPPSEVVEECVVVAADPDALLFQAVSVDQIGPLDATALACLAPGERRAVEQAEITPDDVLTAQPLPTVGPAELAKRRRTTLRPLDDFGVGSVIEAADAPVEPPDLGSHSFLMEVDGEPYRYPLDRPIPFVVREIGGPANGLTLVRTALQAISDVGGLRFEFRGLTNDFPDDEQRRQPNLWIGWVFPEEEERFLTETIIGLGGPHGFVASDDRGHITGGMATVKADLDLPAEFGPVSMGEVLLHEIGHALNLGHVDSRAEVMYPSQTPDGPALLGPGDTRGLWLLGVGRPSGAGALDAPGSQVT